MPDSTCQNYETTARGRCIDLRYNIIQSVIRGGFHEFE